MLYPQSNRSRTIFDLSGIWEMRKDPNDQGEVQGWTNGFESEAYIGIPGSWNEQLAEIGMMNYVGSVWYKFYFYIPDYLLNKKLLMRFGSVDFHAKVWVNGAFVGEHNGGYLPFEFNITPHIKESGKNILIVQVNNELTHDTIPQGITVNDYQNFGKNRDQTYPTTAFDFFAYGGIQRPVKITALNEFHLANIKVETKFDGSTGKINLEAEYCNVSTDAKVNISVFEKDKRLNRFTCDLKNQILKKEFIIPNCRAWCPDDPFLYKIQIELFKQGELIDEYILEVGIREVEIKGSKLLLNGKPIFLKGFGKHEDFAVLGKGLSYPLIVKDFELMKWIGANSFRTSHYPYAEEVMQMADRLGFLVIDEVPAVSLNFRHVTPNTLENHKNSLKELILRDRNHPSVICWSVANEPGIWGEDEAGSDKAENYWEEIFQFTRNLDSSRPIILPACIEWKDKDLSFKYSDILSINRYWGWYDAPTDIDRVGELLKNELVYLYERYDKPIFISEFGADTIEGEHATFPQLYTEEYQTMLIMKYFEVIESLPFTIGEHVWNFADFRTAQHHRRVILNRKGIFNRERAPKSAAFAIRKHWTKE